MDFFNEIAFYEEMHFHLFSKIIFSIGKNINSGKWYTFLTLSS